MMLSMRDEAQQVMDENKHDADYDQFLLDTYRKNPGAITFNWSTKNMDDMGMGGESYREYNERVHDRVIDGQLAMQDPETMQWYIERNRGIENIQRRLIRALNFFIGFAKHNNN